MNYSWEAGAEARFLNSRIGFNLTFYKTNTGLVRDPRSTGRTSP